MTVRPYDAQELQQVSFCISDQILLAQRFVSGFALLTNITFNPKAATGRNDIAAGSKC